MRIGRNEEVETMLLRNTTLDDIAAVCGFTAALRISAWFGSGGNLYVPLNVDEGQFLVRLLGLPVAKRLCEAWPGEHIAVPSIATYDSDLKKRRIVELLQRGMTPRSISHFLSMTERRVQQIIRELEVAGLVEPLVENSPAKSGVKKALGKTGRKSRR